MKVKVQVELQLGAFDGVARALIAGVTAHRVSIDKQLFLRYVQTYLYLSACLRSTSTYILCRYLGPGVHTVQVLEH